MASLRCTDHSHLSLYHMSFVCRYYIVICFNYCFYNRRNEFKYEINLKYCWDYGKYLYSIFCFSRWWLIDFISTNHSYLLHLLFSLSFSLFLFLSFSLTEKCREVIQRIYRMYTNVVNLLFDYSLVRGPIKNIFCLI